MNYWVLRAQSPDGAIIDMLPEGSPTNWKVHTGQSLARQFPAGGRVAFSDHFPERRKLYDFVRSTQGVIIASPKVRQVLESLQLDNLEFLPITLCDHQWTQVAEGYSILNVLGSQEAIDMEKSKYKIDPITKREISRLKSLVLQKGKIDPQAHLFRCSMMMELILMSDRVYDAFVKEGVTGFVARPAEGFSDLLA
jgi:hypothetical protein